MEICSQCGRECRPDEGFTYRDRANEAIEPRFVCYDCAWEQQQASEDAVFWQAFRHQEPPENYCR